MKKIKLTEKDLHSIVKNSVEKVLNESVGTSLIDKIDDDIRVAYKHLIEVQEKYNLPDTAFNYVAQWLFSAKKNINIMKNDGETDPMYQTRR